MPDSYPKNNSVLHNLIHGTAVTAWVILKTVWLTIWTVYQLAVGGILVCLIWGGLQVGEYFSLWDIRNLRQSPPKTTAFIKAEKDRLTDSLRLAGIWPPPDTIVKWAWIPLDSIPKFVQEVVLVAEDAKFFEHQGFDLEQIEYAMVANHQAGKKARGASTITQQVAKNLYLSKDKEMSRKLREAVISVLLEHYLSKPRILEIYLNVAQFDAGVFGIRAGSRHHFNKEPGELTQEEAFNLLALLPNPVNWDFRKPNNAFLQHKRLVQKNFAFYKGLKQKTDSTGSNWQSQVYSDLAEQLSEERWKSLRTRPNIDPGGENSEDTSGSAGTEADPTAPRPGLGSRLRTF